MKTYIMAGLVLMMSGAAVQAQETVDIDPVNGKLTATIPADAVYSVQWIGALDSTNGWQQSWGQMRDQKSEDGNVEIDIPVAFRLTSWTNGVFLNAPVGRTFHYKVTNEEPREWRREIKVLGDIYLPQTDDSYRVCSVVEYYEDADDPPLGAQSRNILFLRSDETTSYRYDKYNNEEFSPWQAGTNQTSWSYFSSQVETTNIATIINSSVDVDITTTNGVVTYTDCVEIETIGTDNGFDWQDAFTDRRYTDWIKPGGFIVRSENYWLFSTDQSAAPVIYELQGWTDE